MKLKYRYVIPLLFSFTCIFCSTEERGSKPADAVLNHFLKYSRYTDPGAYAHLYDILPESIEQICDVIKKQLIHPYDVKKFADRIPEGREYEDQDFPTVSDMLKELIKRDKRGLTASRQPEDRLIVACVHHSMLLASILRYRGIPVRIRAGYARYIGGDRRVRVTHVVCEVWDKTRKKWFLVDPDRNRVDLERKMFEFAFDTWLRLLSDRITKKTYISRYESVDQATAHVLCLDLSYIVGTEEIYWKDPTIVHKIGKNYRDLSKPELQLLDQIAQWLNYPDSHLEELIQIQAGSPSLQYEE